LLVIGDQRVKSAGKRYFVFVTSLSLSQNPIVSPYQEWVPYTFLCSWPT
jgi:hypothetical protein